MKAEDLIVKLVKIVVDRIPCKMFQQICFTVSKVFGTTP